MQKIISLMKPANSIAQSTMALLSIILGSLLLSITSQFAFPLPFSPVPISLQTWAVALLAMTLGPKKAPFAVLAYLFQATIGLPVTVGGLSNPLWMVGPTAGYLLGFFVSSYVTAKIIQNHSSHSFLKTWLKLSINEGIILVLGFAWLSYLFGFDKAFTLGVAPFIPGACLKITMATASYRPIQWLREKFS